MTDRVAKLSGVNEDMGQRTVRTPAQPLLSVVVPLFNKRRFIGRAIQSIKSQTFTEFEAIIVDDGSSDGGASAAAEAIADDPRFRLLSKANGGVSSARNAGARAATGHWVAFLDADDEWRPEFLASVRDVIETAPGVTMVSAAYEQRVPNELIINDWDFGNRGDVIVDYDFLGLWAKNGGPPVWSSAVALNRRAMLEVGGFPDGVALGEDILAWMAMLPTGRRAFIARLLSISHADDTGSLTRAPSLATVLSHERLVESVKTLSNSASAKVRAIVGTTHCYMLMRVGAKTELVRFLLRHGTFVPPRTWLASLAYLAGLGRFMTSVSASDSRSAR
jgi:glycosyltransferase involved in cell wall biosynthesis